MQSPNDHHVWQVRALLEATQTPFSVAGHRPRSVIFRQGDRCDSVMHIEKGRVRLGVTARSGKEAICGLLGMGAFLGEEALAGQSVRRQTATAMTATEVLVVAKAQMIRLLRTQPAVADRFIAAHPRAQYPPRSRPDRSAPPLGRAAPGTHAAPVGRLRRAAPEAMRAAQRLARDHRGDGRNHTLTSQRARWASSRNWGSSKRRAACSS